MKHLRCLLLASLIACNPASTLPSDTKPLFTGEDIIEAYKACVEDMSPKCPSDWTHKQCYQLGYMDAAYCVVNKPGN